MKAVDLVVFDMVGTTVQSSPRIPEAFTRALETAGVQLTPEDITSIRGKSKVAAIRELLADRFHADDTEELIRNTYAAFKSYLLDCYRDGPVQPIEGASDVFTWCNEEAIGIALTFFEFMVQCLQAYIFTLLTALYIAGALADEH